MSTLKFVCRKDKLSRSGLCPLQLCYQISGERKYYNPQIKVYPGNWNDLHQQVIFIRKGKLFESEVIDLNNKLNRLRKKILSIEESFTADRVHYSPEVIIGRLKECPENKKHTTHVLPFIDKYLEENKATRIKSSLSVYRTLKNHLTGFSGDITFDKIDYSFFQGFQNYLLERAGLANTSCAKNLSTLKTFLNYARLAGIAVSDGYRNFKIRKENLEVIALTSEEFEALFYMDLSANDALARVRDTFCFACSTGLRYSDIAQLRKEHIKRDEIRLTVKKTKELLTIPINHYAKTILNRYAEFLLPLPVISSQKTNEHLKNLCKFAGISEEIEIVRYRGIKREVNVYPKHELISFHVARKTFCTLSLEKGMSAEETMSISGHSDYRSFKRYVKVTEQRKKLVMRKAWDAPLKAVS